MNATINDDPTLDQMREHLTACGLYEADEDTGLDSEGEVAIWHFACGWHGGASSNLYRVLSVDSPYRPGPNTALEDEGEAAGICYAELVAKFTSSPR